MNPGEFVTSVVDSSVHGSTVYLPQFLDKPFEFVQAVAVGSLALPFLFSVEAF